MARPRPVIADLQNQMGKTDRWHARIPVRPMFDPPKMPCECQLADIATTIPSITTQIRMQLAADRGWHWWKSEGQESASPQGARIAGDATAASPVDLREGTEPARACKISGQCLIMVALLKKRDQVRCTLLVMHQL